MKVNACFMIIVMDRDVFDVSKVDNIKKEPPSHHELDSNFQSTTTTTATTASSTTHRNDLPNGSAPSSLLSAGDLKLSNGSSNLNDDSDDHHLHNHHHQDKDVIPPCKLHKIFSEDSMKLFAHSFSLPDNVWPILSEDVVYRLRELVTNSYQFTKHSKQVRLACDDVNKALYFSDSPKIFGYGHGKGPLKEVFCPSAGVWATEDEPVDLMSTSRSIIQKTYRCSLIAESPQYRIDWLSIDTKVKREYEQPGSDEHKKFESALTFITQGLLSREFEVFSYTLDSLRTVSEVQLILPQLVGFLATTIRKGHGIYVTRQLLLAIRALCRNQSIQITNELFTRQLVNSVLHCILRYPCESNINEWGYDHWNLREFAACILSDMIKEFSSSFVYNKVYNHVTHRLLACIRDPTAFPYSSHYGAIVAFRGLGFDCVVNHFYPHFSNYFSHLYHSIKNDKFEDNNEKYSAHAAMGALSSLGSLLILKFKGKLLLNNEICDYSQIAKEILEFFGDRVAIQIPTDTTSGLHIIL
ncbi:TAF6-like RNA polymerase II p300/CBP-associated factor-associated factor 65 kDa subunit 6L [Brevipalpus obovatus]|uniref:TAF6-like RNA polymerase II p300/CBP-associated factor-associated factor 65 kDa subunit 6L n=1 Tax=Brevipalpus obovatus TaxID=246614 RepID=UPI003D9E4FD2